jgi:ribosomal protein S18 acetylase RimI-like enzyme
MPQDVPALLNLWQEMADVQAEGDPRLRPNPMATVVLKGWFEDQLAGDRSMILVAVKEGLPSDLSAEALAKAEARQADVAIDGSAKDGRIVGYAYGTIVENPPVFPNQFYGYFSDLSVSASARREGVGTLLADAMQQWFRSRHLPYALVNVSALNPGARAFWRKRGYGEFVEKLRLEL